jgi:hypothetical protein
MAKSSLLSFSYPVYCMASIESIDWKPGEPTVGLRENPAHFCLGPE